MTYDRLAGYLGNLKFDYEEGNITYLNVNFLRALISMEKVNTSDTCRLLFFRFQQVKNLYNINEMFQIFLLSQYFDEKLDREIYNMLLDTCYFIRENGLNSEKSKLKIQELNKHISYINNYLENKSYKDLYKEIETKIGNALFEETRYKLNIYSYEIILQLYGLLLDKNGNLDNKEVFINLTSYSPNTLKLCYNTIFLAKKHNKFKDIKGTIYKYMNNLQLASLYNLYEELLNLNPNFYKVSKALKVIENSQEDKYNKEYFEKTRTILNHNYGNLSYEEMNNLYIIFEGKSKYTDKEIVEVGKERIKYKKLPNFIAPPIRSHETDAGADLFSPVDMTIYPNERVSLPLGLAIEVPSSYMAVVYTKSGTFKKGLIAYDPPIDAGYTGEIHALLHNIDENPIHIKKGDKVAQLVIIPIVLAEFIEADELISGERGNGAFGSTGTSLVKKI